MKHREKFFTQKNGRQGAENIICDSYPRRNKAKIKKRKAEYCNYCRPRRV